MAVFLVVGSGAAMTVMAGSMAWWSFEDGGWGIGVAASIMTVVAAVGTVAACIAVA